MKMENFESAIFPIRLYSTGPHIGRLYLTSRNFLCQNFNFLGIKKVVGQAQYTEFNTNFHRAIFAVVGIFASHDGPLNSHT